VLFFFFKDDKSSSRANSSATLLAAAAEDEATRDEELVEVGDPQDVLGEMAYEFDLEENNGDLLTERSDTGGGIEYKAASIVKLVELLSSSDIPSGNMIVDDVLCTYPTFVSGLNLFNMFLKRYIGPQGGGTPKQQELYEKNKKDIQNRVGSFLARWMTSSTDFSDNAQLFSYFKKLVEMNFFDPTPSLAKYFAKKYDECRKKRLGLDTVIGGISGDKMGKGSGTLRGKRGGTLRGLGGMDSSNAMAAMRQVREKPQTKEKEN
jgi:hypothetical protein